MLVARMGWPVTSARWWTMQELATLLGDPAAKTETEAALLQLLGSRKLEAEVVEVLCIFWIASKASGYEADPVLAAKIPKPSILSDMLLEELGLLREGDDGPLESAPDDFVVPHDFSGIHGSQPSRVFRACLQRLERHTGFPLERQMAFEWSINHAAYPEAPYQGDPWHFQRPLGDGFAAQVCSRTALRGISAYLRTLEVAEAFWKMPPGLAEAQALLAMPIHPTLAFLRPQRPSWLEQITEFAGDGDYVNAYLRGLINRMETARPGDELLAFSAPVVMSMERCVEVTLVRWCQAPGSQVAKADLAEHLKDFFSRGTPIRCVAGEPLDITTQLAPNQLDDLMDPQSMAWPLAVPLGFDRIGYLQPDLYPTRLFLPTFFGKGSATVVPRGGQLEVNVDAQMVAELSYWNAGWGAARPMQLGGNCGTALTSRGTKYRENAGASGTATRSFYLWQVRTLHRSETFNRFDESVATGVLFL